MRQRRGSSSCAGPVGRAPFDNPHRRGTCRHYGRHRTRLHRPTEVPRFAYHRDVGHPPHQAPSRWDKFHGEAAERDRYSARGARRSIIGAMWKGEEWLAPPLVARSTVRRGTVSPHFHARDTETTDGSCPYTP